MTLSVGCFSDDMECGCFKDDIRCGWGVSGMTRSVNEMFQR